MQTEKESRKEMKSRLYSLLKEKQNEDKFGGHSGFLSEKCYSFDVKLQEPVNFDEASDILEKAADASGLGYARLGLISNNAQFGVVYLKRSEKHSYINKLFNPFSYSILENSFIKTGFYPKDRKISIIYINCESPKNYGEKFIDFFLNLYQALYPDRNLPIDEYIN